mmetsp:Transcript_2485/g.6029  ORF Transcript_2485/g.6029 Transcript_2485/m.6029 type:complete len:235 (-) Transcript_2485:166-870(-)
MAHRAAKRRPRLSLRTRASSRWTRRRKRWPSVTALPQANPLRSRVCGGVMVQIHWQCGACLLCFPSFFGLRPGEGLGTSKLVLVDCLLLPSLHFLFLALAARLGLVCPGECSLARCLHPDPDVCRRLAQRKAFGNVAVVQIFDVKNPLEMRWVRCVRPDEGTIRCPRGSVKSVGLRNGTFAAQLQPISGVLDFLGERAPRSEPNQRSQDVRDRDIRQLGNAMLLQLIQVRSLRR